MLGEIALKPPTKLYRRLRGLPDKRHDAERARYRTIFIAERQVQAIVMKSLLSHTAHAAAADAAVEEMMPARIDFARDTP